MGPEVFGIISLGASLLGSGIGAAGSLQQASATAASQRYQAQVASNNQLIADQNARYAASAGRAKAQVEDFKTARILGEQTAAQGASGLDLTTGSPVSTREGTQQFGRLNTLRTVQDANLTAYGYKTQAQSLGAQATLDRATAGQATAAGFLGAGTSLLGGASSFADKWSQYQLRGVLPGGGGGGFTGNISDATNALGDLSRF